MYPRRLNYPLTTPTDTLSYDDLISQIRPNEAFGMTWKAGVGVNGPEFTIHTAEEFQKGLKAFRSNRAYDLFLFAYIPA